MQEILTPNQICSWILASKSPLNGKENFQTNQMNSKSTPKTKLFSDLVSSPQLRDLQKQLSTGKLFSDILKSYRHFFYYSIPEIFSKSQNHRSHQSNSSAIHYQFLVLMNSYLSVCIQHETVDIEKGISLLTAINNYLLNFANFSNRKAIQIAISAFFNLYMCIISHVRSNTANEIYIETLLGLVMDFFVMPCHFSMEHCSSTSTNGYEIQNTRIFGMLSETIKQLIKPNERSLNPLAAQMVTFVDSLVLQIGKSFPAQELKSIIQTCCGGISGLDTSVLTLLSHLSGIIDIQTIQSFLPVLPFSILSYTNCYAKPNSKDEDNEITPLINMHFPQEPPVQCLNDTAYFYPENSCIRSNFDDSIDLSNSIKFPEILPLEQFLPSDLLMKINLIMKVVTSHSLLTTNFLQLCPKVFQTCSQSSRSLDAYAIFLILLKQIAENAKFEIHLPIELISHQTCFTPSITIFSLKKEELDDKLQKSYEDTWKKINTLRTIAINLIAKQGIYHMQTLLYSTMIYPELFAEIVHRFLNIQDLIKIDQKSIVVLSQTIMSPMIYYQHFLPKNDDSENKKEICGIREARISILLFVNNLFSEIPILRLFFEDKYFIEAFLSLLYEKPLRQVVVFPLSIYFAQKDSTQNQLLINQIITIAQISLKNIELLDSIDLLNHLLTVINKAIIMNASFASLFKPIMKDICKECIKLQKHSDSEKLLYSIIQFLTLTAANNSIATPEFMAIEKSIFNVFDGKPNPVLFGKIIQLLAGQALPSLHPSFTIRHPKTLRLLVEVFKSSSMLTDVFSFIAKLFQNSVKNCEEAHHGEFDLYLINFLDQYRNDNSFPIVTYASAVSLLMLISNSISSVSVVHSFISLLCPIEGRVIPYYQKVLVKSLSSMIPSTNKRPLCYLPLTSKTSFNFKGLKGEMFQKGFTATFWIYVNSYDPYYHQQILMMQDIKGDKIVIFVAGRNVLVIFDDDVKQWTAKPELEIPLYKWCFVAVCGFMDNKMNHFRVSASINGVQSHDIFFPKYCFAPGTLKGQIGGLTFDSKDVEYPSRLGCIGLYPSLYKNQIMSLYELGPCVESIHTTCPLAYFVPFEHAGMLSLKDNKVPRDLNDPNNNVTITTSPIRYFHPVPFCDILISKCGIATILPLFAQISMKLSNGDKFENLGGSIVEMLQNLLALSEFGQKTFYENDGFKIISHLLMKSDDSDLKYALYSQFFILMNELTNEDLKKQLFDYILINVDLWIKCDAENNRRILRHWAKSLIPTFQEIALKSISFSWILSILRAFYWYEPIEKGIAMNIDNRSQNQILNVKDCRNSLISVAQFISHSKFTDLDFKNLLSNILTCPDHKQSFDLLNLLHTLILEKENFLINTKGSMHLISLLQYLLNINDVEIISSTLSIIFDAHYSSIIPEITLNAHIDIILHQLTPSFVTKGMLSQLIELTNAYPEIFPICSWVAMNIGETGIRQMLNKVPPNYTFAQSEFWSLYLVIALYNGNEKFQAYISRYLINCSKESSMETLFATIEIIGRALGLNSDKMKHTVLFEYGKMIQRESLQNIDNYFAHIRHYLFYRIDRKDNEVLQSLFEESPYANPNQNAIDSSPLCPVNSCDGFLEPVYSPKKPSHRRRMKSRSPQVQIEDPSNPVSSPTKRGNRRNRNKRRISRHSLHPNSILCNDQSENNYSPLIAQKALANLNPYQSSALPKESFKAQRTSLMIVGRKEIDYDTSSVNSPSDKLYNVKFMPSDIDEKIKAIARQEFRYFFGIQMNNSQEWSDFDLAKQAFDIYMNRREGKFEEIGALIGSFLAIWDRNIINKLNEQESKFYAILDHYLMLQNQPRVLNCSIYETEQICFSIYQSFETSGSGEFKAAPLKFLKHFLKFQQSNSEKSLDIFSFISNEFVALGSNQIADFLDAIGHQKNQCARLWSRYWSCVTIERAPWHKSLPQKYIKDQHYKRDYSACYALCPMKVKQNNSFNDHMDATFLREQGNYETAKDSYAKYREEYERNHKSVAPVDLLELVEDQKNEHQPSMLFDFDIDNSESNSISQKTDINQQRCIIELPCEMIYVHKIVKATFSLLNDMIIITKEKNNKTIAIYLNQLERILFRTHLHHPTAIEIFLTNGLSYLINFINVKSTSVIRLFGFLSLPKVQYIQNNDNFKLYFKSLTYTQDWINGKISNFEYLMHLNIFSGRSFNETSQYPIMPWIIQDYDSSSLDLSKKSTFRDLSKPMGAINPKRLNELIQKANTLKNLGMETYLYSSGLINPLSIYLYNLRMEPFTTLHIEIQSGKFDHCARLFNSVPISYKLASNNMNDYRELIPEFFYASEIFENKNHFDFGTLNGKKANNVELPNWASTPFEFIYLHRKALESDYVSQNLHKWIDLVWGYKQRGQIAIKENNTYLPAMYDDVWDKENNSQNPATRTQIEAILTHVGQVPHQLFEKSHLQKCISMESNKIYDLIGDPIQYSLQDSSNTEILLSIILPHFSPQKMKILSIDNLGNNIVSIINIENMTKALSRQKQRAALKSSKSGFPRSLSNGPCSFPSKALDKSSTNDQIYLGSKTERSKSDASTSLFKCVPFHETLMPSVSTTRKIIKNSQKILPAAVPNKKYVYSYSKDLDCLFIGSSNKNSELHHICFGDYNNENTFLMDQCDDIVCIASDKDWIATANRDAIVHLYKVTETPNTFMNHFSKSKLTEDSIKHKFVFPSYTSSISCIALNDDFHTIVCGTRDGSLLFYSLTTAKIIKCVNLKTGRRPSSLLITPAWGFVVVYETFIQDGKLLHAIEVFSINGELIRSTTNQQIQISRAIKSWSAFRDNKGFDYVIMTNDKNECFLTEAFYLNDLDHPFFAAQSNITAISFLNDESVALVATTNGDIIFVPFRL